MNDPEIIREPAARLETPLCSLVVKNSWEFLVRIFRGLILADGNREYHGFLPFFDCVNIKCSRFDFTTPRWRRTADVMPHNKI
jgi:hypothetical protein